MSNLIYACWRNPADACAAGELGRVADRITPAGIQGHPHRLVEGPGESLCLTGPAGAGGIAGLSAHLGAFAGAWPEWHRPGTPVPEGSFALVRGDGGTAEICTDFAGTRTLWYAFDQRVLFVSTSQRALVCLLRSLSLNRPGFAWFLSSGTLGPVDSWDQRIRRIPADSRLVLDRQRWSVELHTAPVAFQARAIGEAAAREELLRLLKRALNGYPFQAPQWILPLSGGYDSRFMLALLHDHGFRPRTVTWGLASSRTQRGNDAFVARQLAEHYGLANDYFVTERSGAPPAEVVDTFMAAHGGTTDGLFPYLDGLQLWSGFTRDGVAGIIRGDEGFGTRPRPEEHHRYAQGLVLLRDFLDEGTAEAISDGRQQLPESFRRQGGESVQTYGDRLVHAFFIPVDLASLNDVKAPFLEIANPMLCRSVLEFIRQLPDPMRAGRALYERMARAICPAIPIAKIAADDSRSGFLGHASYVQWMAEELQGGFAERMLPQGFRATLAASLHSGVASLSGYHSTRAVLKRIIPKPLVVALRSWSAPVPPEIRLLAYRAALASRLSRILEADAATLAS